MFKSTLEENKYSLTILEQVLTASKYLASDGQLKLSLSERIKNLQNAKEILTDNEHLSKLDVYKHLMREHLRLTDVLHSNCIANWRKQIELLENSTDNQKSWHTMLKITCAQEDIGDSLLALKYFDSLNDEIKLFANKLIDLIIKPILLQNLTVEVTKSVHASTMVLKVSTNNNDEYLSTKMRKLKEAFSFLNSTLPVNVDGIKIMSYLGSYVSQPFLDVFKNTALFNALPTQYNCLKNFQIELDNVLEFNAYLIELGNIYN